MSNRRGATVRTTRLVLAAGLLLAASFGTAGCADSPPSTTSSGEQGQQPLSPEDAMLAYTQCMREHGVDMPDPDSSGHIILGEGIQNDPDYEQAHGACEEVLTQGQPKMGGGMDADQRQQMLDFASCMREHGIDMPDPDFGNGGGSISLGDVDPGDPQVQAAADECQRDLGMPEPGDG